MSQQRPPWWFIVIIIVLLLPAGQFPMLLANTPVGVPLVRTLLWCYPFYLLVAAYLAYVCFQRRPLMSWILIALMALTHIAMWLLVFSDLKI